MERGGEGVNQMNAAEIIDSDQRILGSTRRDGNIFIFEAEGFGPPFRGQMPENINAAALMHWCNAVRGEFNERFRKQEAEADVPAPDVQGSQGATSAPTGDTRGSLPPVPESPEDAQAQVEEDLVSKVADLEARIAECEAEEQAAHGVVDAMRKRRQSLRATQRVYAKLLRGLK